MKKVMPLRAKCAFSILTLVAGLSAVLSGGRFLMAQTNMGTISGIVSDPSGNVVPKANVKLSNENTNVTASTESDSAGVYVFPHVLPGPYTLTVVMSGFNTSIVNHVVVYVNQQVTENVKLSLGSVSTSVQVQAKLSLVQTESSSAGGVITTSQVAAMPLNNRTNIFGLLALAPGVQSSGSNARIGGDSWRGSAFETTDGVMGGEIENTRINSYGPSLDSIGEFKVVDSTGSAADGPGTQEIIIATRGGTNQLHGTAFEYNQVDTLEAANFFATSVPKAAFRTNQFGGSLGGPIKRNKAFFFGSFEGFKYAYGSTESDEMPTAALLNGDFSGLPAVIDPETGQPFPGNQIPSDRISSVSKEFFPYFETPNIPTSALGGLGVNYRVNLPDVQSNYRYQGRADYNLNAGNTISATYYLVRVSPNKTAGPTALFGGTSFPTTNQNLALDYTRTISPSVVNVATFGYSRQSDLNFALQNYNLQPSTLIPGIPPSLPGLGGLPTISITGFTGLSDNGGSGDLQQASQAQDTLTWVKGGHTIKGGFSWMRWDFLNYQNPSPGHGSFSSTGQYTGNAFADFLLGDLAGSSKDIAGLSATPTNDQFGMFIQDSWKATRRLTLNAGLRYDISTIFENTTGNMANWYPNLNEMVILQGTNNGLFSTLPIVSGSSVGINTSNYIGNDDHRFAPRVGFAYSALGSGRLVVRGGYGMYYSFMPMVFGDSWYSALQVPWSGSESFEPQAGPTPTLTFANPFPTGAGSVPTAVSAYAMPRNYRYPMSNEWNFTLESQLSNSMAVRATYFGNETEHENIDFPLNNPVPAPGPVQPLRPYQPWGSIYYLENGESSNEQSLQLAVTRQFTSGLGFQAQYAWTKALDTGPYNGDEASTLTDNLNQRLDRGNDAFIRQQYLVANYIYDLPFGKGERFLSTLSGPLNVILGGWETSGIVTVGSGLPYSVNFSSSVQGWPSSHANIVGNPHVPNPNLSEWFNPAAYALPLQFAYGDSAPYSLFGPGYSNWDMSVLKVFHLNERFALQFRSDFFNTLNHPNFGTPQSNISVPSTVGRITGTTGAPRAIQFALRLSF